MPYEIIDLAQNGNISFSIRRLARSESPLLSIIHIAFSGTYRIGSAGRPDAYYIRGITQTLSDIWHPSRIIFDLADLSYQWGDEMELVLESPNKTPFAIIVSSKCAPALSTLEYGEDSKESVLQNEGFFDTFEAADRYIREKVIEQWNALIADSPALSANAKQICPEGF